MATVSVAMAVYNGEKYIQEQLDSILKQLSDEDELVISYDESADKTLDIIKEYAEKWPQVKVYYDPGCGVFSNFENAISKCEGDYIFISDQDDVWDKNKISHIVEAFEQTKADMIIHNGVHIDRNGDVISEDFFGLYNIRKGIIRNFLRPRYSGCCTAFTKKMKQLILPIPPQVGAYDHWIGMIGETQGEIIFDSKVLLYHRLHGDNVTVSTRNPVEILRSRWNLLVSLIKVKKAFINN